MRWERRFKHFHFCVPSGFTNRKLFLEPLFDDLITSNELVFNSRLGKKKIKTGMNRSLNAMTRERVSCFNRQITVKCSLFFVFSFTMEEERVTS